MEMKLGLLVFLALVTQFASSYELKEVVIDFSKQFKTFTVKEIAKYDGTDESKPIYMAVKGTVFDVTPGKSFYGKGSAYNALVGKDASRAVAKMSLEPDDLNNNLEGLTDQQLKSLDDIYAGTYSTKYKVVGYMNYLVSEQKKQQQKQQGAANDEL